MKYSTILFTVIVLFCMAGVHAEAQRGDVLWKRSEFISAGAFSFSPDSSEILTNDTYRNVVIRSTETGDITRQFPFGRYIQSSCWSPNGDTIAVVSSETLYLLHAVTGEILKQITDLPDMVEVKYSPDGTYLLTHKYVFKTTDYTDVSALFKGGRLYSLFVLPGDTNALTYAGSDTLALISIPDGKIIKKLTHAPINPSRSVDKLDYHRGTGKIAVMHLDTVFVFTIPDSNSLQKFHLKNISYHAAAGFAPNGHLVAIKGNMLYDIDPVTKNITEFSLEFDFIQNSRIIVNKTGKTYIAGNTGAFCPPLYMNSSIFRSLKIWDIQNAKMVFPDDSKGFSQPILSTEFLDNYTKIRTTHSDSVMITWDMQTGGLLKKERTDIIKRDTSSKTSITAPNGKYRLEIAQDRALIIRDMKNDSLLRYLQGGYTLLSTYAVMFSPDSKYIIGSFQKNVVGGGSDTDIRYPLLVWDVETGKVKYLYDTECEADLIYLTPGNRQIVAITKARGIFVLDSRDIISSVENSQPENLLKTTIYPNPLHETGTISYSVLKPGLLKISVHDIFGREVMVLKNEFSEPGNYTIPFKSSELSSGTYFLKVVGGGEVTTTQFSILR